MPGETNADCIARLAGQLRAAEIARDQTRTELTEHWYRDRDEMLSLRVQRDAALALADEMHDVMHAAVHQPSATWGTVAVYVAYRLRQALGAETPVSTEPTPPDTDTESRHP